MKVVIVDDHPLVRQGLKSLLSLDDTMEVIGEANNKKEALHILSINKTDIVLVDIRLGNECGLDVVKKAKEKGMTCKFIVLTSSSSQEDFLRAEELNVDGYILKEALPEELLYAVRLVSKGRKYYDPGLLENKIKRDEHSLIQNITPREQEVLEALGRGLTNKQIARDLFITEHTVKKHVSQILAKLNLNDRTQAALYANNNGLVTFKETEYQRHNHLDHTIQ